MPLHGLTAHQNLDEAVLQRASEQDNALHLADKTSQSCEYASGAFWVTCSNHEHEMHHLSTAALATLSTQSTDGNASSS